MGCCDSTTRFEYQSSGQYIQTDQEDQVTDNIIVKTISLSKRNITRINSGKLSKHYKIVSKINHAGIGLTYQGRSLQSNQAVMIKRIARWYQGCNKKKNAKDLRHLLILDHPNLVKTFEIIEDQDSLLIINEFCSGGSLLKYFREKKAFTEDKVKAYIRQILQAVNYCHNQGMTHGNIDPERLLFETINNDSVLKLVDFGLGNWEDVASRRNDACYIQYRSPEVLSGEATPKSDIWSIGVLLYVMLSGDKPFKGYNVQALRNQIKKGKFKFDGLQWRLISTEAKMVIKQMLRKNPNKRPTAQELLNMTWFQSLQRPLKSKRNTEILKELATQANQCNIFQELKQAVTLYVANTFATQVEVQELRELFICLDENDDGVLDIQELLQGADKVGLGMSKEEILHLFNEIDLDSSGTIEYSEFLTATLNKKELLHKRRLQDAFRSIDTDESGTISLSELQALFNVMDDDDNITNYLRDLIAMMSTSGNEEITFEEFSEAITRVQSIQSNFNIKYVNV